MSSLFRRIGWASLDQAFASVSNLLLSLAVARQSSTNDFGSFGLAFAIYLLAIGVTRSLVGDPTLLRAPSWKAKGLRYHIRNRNGLLSASLIAGLIVGSILFISTIWMPEGVRTIMIVMSCSIPGLVLFDATRYWYFSNAHPKSAAMMDLGWLLLQMVAFVLLFSFGSADAVSLTSMWAASGVAIVAIAALRANCRFSFEQGAWWMKRNKDLSWNFLGEFATLSGVQQGVTFLTAAFAGLAGVGSIRAAQTILGPVNIVTGSASVIVLPYLRTRLTKRTPKLPWSSLLVSATLAAVVGAACAVVAMIPEGIGRELLGLSWASGQEVALILGISLALNSISYGATSGLRAMEQSRVSLRLRVTTAPLALAMVAFGAATGGAVGAVHGLVTASAIQCLAWWIVYICIWCRRKN